MQEWIGGAIAGAVTGVAGSLLTPWGQYFVTRAHDRTALRVSSDLPDLRAEIDRLERKWRLA